MKKIKIVYLGSSNFSLSFIKKLFVKKNVDIAGICSVKNKKKKFSDYVDLTSYAKKNKINNIYWDTSNYIKTLNWIKKIKPDYLFCIGWPYLLNNKILNSPKYFCVGFHPSDIPNNRGRHPIIWSIILNFRIIYSTFFIITKEADFGPVISKKKIKISKKINSTKVYDLIIKKSDKQLSEILKKIKLYNKLNLNTWLNTNKFKMGNFLRKRSYKDGIIDWRMDANDISRLVNALKKPYPFASFVYKNKEYKVKEVKIIKNSLKVEPGKVISIDNNKPIIKTGKNAIKLQEISPNKKFRFQEHII